MIALAARRALRRGSVVALGALVLATLAGCIPLEPDPQPTVTGLAQPGAVAPLAPLVIPAVLRYCPLVDAVHDDRYLLPVDDVYICRGDGKHDTDGVSSFGPWESASRIDHPAALMKAYRVSDAPKSRGLCTYFRHDPLIVWVHHDGVTSAYYAPVDDCGNPSAAAIAAYQAAKRTLLIDVDRGAPVTSEKDSTG